MGRQYESELKHVNTLCELSRKPPLFMRAKWTECAGTIIEAGSRPSFNDFLQFVKRRAMFVNNDFGKDLCTNVFKVKKKGKEMHGRFLPRSSSLTAGAYKHQNGNGRNPPRVNHVKPSCSACSSQHRIWRCDKFKNLSYQDKRKLVQESRLCTKCLGIGHYARQCPKNHFRYRREGCQFLKAVLQEREILRPGLICVIWNYKKWRLEKSCW